METYDVEPQIIDDYAAPAAPVASAPDLIVPQKEKKKAQRSAAPPPKVTQIGTDAMLTDAAYRCLHSLGSRNVWTCDSHRRFAHPRFA